MHADETVKRTGNQFFVVWVSVIVLGVLWVFVGFGNASVIRETIAVPLVLLVPGALLVMMLPGRPKDPFFQFALSVGLSIALCIIVGLLLNIAPSGIDRRAWTCTLGFISMAEAIIVAGRRDAAAATYSGSSPKDLFRTDTKSMVTATVAALAIVCGLASIIAWERSNAESANRRDQFAELWVQRASGGNAVVGVQSERNGINRFRLSVSTAGQPSKEFTFTLDRQKTWKKEMSVVSVTTQRVHISLYDASSSQASESVWYNSTSGD